MNLVIGLYGESCAGKTSVAKRVARRLKIKIRHCGEIVKARAKQLGVEVEDLPKEEHRRIDQETRKLVKSADRLIIEGRFLNQVLKGLPNVILIKLTCDRTERLRREAERKGKVQTDSQEGRRDRANPLYRRQTSGAEARFTIRTGKLTISEVTETVLRRIKEVQE